MKRFICVFLIFCMCMGLVGCNNGAKADLSDPESTGKKAELDEDKAFDAASNILKNMSLDEKIGQLIMVDLDSLAEGGGPVTKMSGKLADKIKEYKLGGVYLDSANVKDEEQIKKLNEELAACLDIPLYIATEEGGGTHSIAFKNGRNPSKGHINASEMGKNMTESQIEAAGQVIGQELKELGFNLNFAPTADVFEQEKFTEPKKISDCVTGVLGEAPQYKKPPKKMSSKKKKKRLATYQKKLDEYNKNVAAFTKLYMEQKYIDRCFGQDTDSVSDAVSAFVSGMRKGGTGSALKIFPGIASVARYHKLILCQIDTGLSRMRRTNLKSFSAGIEAGADMIMVGHVALEKIDSGVPASLSRTIISGILRKELAFDGVVITEPLNLPVITSEYTTEQAVIRAVVSGVDMVYAPEDIDEAVLALKRAVMFNDIDVKVIDEAVLHILKNKLMRGIYKVQQG